MPTVTTYNDTSGWYWVQVDESGDPWYNQPGGPFLTQNEAWADAKEHFRKLREIEKFKKLAYRQTS